MTSSAVHLGFDLGTTVTKVAVVDNRGVHLQDFGVPTDWTQLGHGRAERRPTDLMQAVDSLIAMVGEYLDPHTVIASIGFTSMAEAGVLVDRNGTPCSPVIAWHDPRGAEHAASLATGLASDFSAMTGLPVSHVATVFKLAWMRDEGLDLRGRQWLSLPEFVIAGLGGRRVAERSMLGRTGLLDIHTNRPWQPAFDYLEVGVDLVPEIVGAGTPVGSVRNDHPVPAARGAVLTVAGHDHLVAAAAAGCGTPGSALDSFGTAEAFVAAADHVPEPATVRHLVVNGISVYPHVVHGTTGFIAGTRTGLVLKRVLRALGCDHEPARSGLDQEALHTPAPDPADITVTGYAMSDRDVTLQLASDELSPAQIWRAAIDGGTAVGSARLEQLRRAGIAIDRLVVAGGWARMESVLVARKDLAPIVEVSRLAQAGTYGAARFGQWAALDRAPDSSTATPPHSTDWASSNDGRPPAGFFTNVDPT